MGTDDMSTGVALGALGILAGGAAASVAAGASAANLSAGAGLSDPAFAALVSAAIGVAALLTLLTTQRFLRRRQARAGAAGTSSQYCPQTVSGSAVSTIAATLQRSRTR